MINKSIINENVIISWYNMFWYIGMLWWKKLHVSLRFSLFSKNRRTATTSIYITQEVVRRGLFTDAEDLKTLPVWNNKSSSRPCFKPFIN